MGTSVSVREVLSSGLLSVIAFIVSVMTSRVGQNGAEWGLSATMLRVLGMDVFDPSTEPGKYGRAAECTRLESERPVKRTGGSNPSTSAQSPW